MLGLDERLASLSDGEALLMIVVVAVLLGLRHATDPDHLYALSTLVAGEREHTPRRAGELGLAWGAGHATTLLVLGAPVVLFDHHLPEWLTQVAETLIGVLIICLAVRVLLRWRAGYFHAHVHTHDGVEHVHLHAHPRRAPRGAAHAGVAHPHPHPAAPRSALGAFGIGLIHGVGGSAGVSVLLVAAIPDDLEAIIALSVFALFTTVSMGIASSGFGFTISRAPVRRVFSRVAPALGALSLTFGAWYALGALEAVTYPF
jgi:ABC-type nickel/cobalt efflux system permease component RcnA